MLTGPAVKIYVLMQSDRVVKAFTDARAADNEAVRLNTERFHDGRPGTKSRMKDAGGAWLVSGRPWPNAVEELPHGPHLRIDLTRQFSRILVFHLTLAGPHGQAGGPPQTGKRKPASYQSKV